MAELSNQQSIEKEPIPRIPSTLLRLLGGIAVHACKKGFERLPNAPEHPPMVYRMMEEEAVHAPQPLHPDVPTTVKNIQEVIAGQAVVPPENLSLSEKIIQSMRLIQFTDRFASKDHAFLDYATIKTHKDRFVSAAKEQSYPLSFGQQLNIALELSDGDILESLNNLCFTSRQYARWLDSVAIRDMPALTTKEVLAEMKEYRSSILACKNADENNFQDPSGDIYYVWTHAFGCVMCGIGSGVSDHIGKFISSHGTDIMHPINKLAGQSVPSNHKIAAVYGNAIGDAILDAIKGKE